MKHVLTINVEDYYQVGAFSHLIPYREWERFEDRLTRNLERTLKLLAEHEASATFFVSGWIADNHPELFPPILEAGHEIGAQGYYQQSIRGIPPAAFRDDIRRSKQLLESVIGREVSGFRVGRGWIGPDDLWALDCIANEGFRYDTSLCPIGRQFSRHPNRFVVDHPTRPRRDFVELPISSQSFLGHALPFAGGNYLRQLPHWFTRRAAAHWVNKLRRPLVAYFHIWELDRYQPDITAAGPLQKIRHYRNLDVMRERLAALLSTYAFTSAEDFLALHTRSLSTPADNAAASVTATPEVRTCSPSPAATPLTIIVPCYNEEASIPYLARTLREFADKAGELELSYVFVDDGSSDNTWTRLETYFGNWDTAELVQLPQNQGIAAAILAGAAAAATELVVVIDADCTFDPKQILGMLPLLDDDISVVVASPFHSEGSVLHVPGWRLLLSRGAAFLYRQVMHNSLSSYTSCFRLYRRKLIADMTIDNKGFCGVTEILARLDLAGHKVTETSAVLQVRLLGQSKIRLLRVISDHLRLIGRLFAARYLAVKLR